VVDPAQRRRDLAEAVWRVIRRDGLEQASVRNVAREAGLSMGSLRHYFSTQSELLSFAMRMVIERIDQRVQALEPVGDVRERVERILAELLPFDESRRTENEVWLAFTARALVDPELRALRDEGYDLLHDACRRMIGTLAEPDAYGAGARDGAGKGLDLDLEAERLYALLDGLAVHAAMRPELHTPQRLTAVISRHLDELTAG
jgi:AcrR family transcriptional regulator